MRIWGPHKNSWIRIQESGSTCIRIQFGMIRGSGPCPYQESFAFYISMSFFYGSAPRIRIRVRVTPNSFRKNLNMIFLKENRIRIKIKLLGGRIRVQTGPNHPGIAFEWHAMPTMEGTVQEDDYRTKVRFKDKNLLKNQSFASSGSQRARIRGLRIQDSDLNLNPDPG
jgi:hypothetical protein